MDLNDLRQQRGHIWEEIKAIDKKAEAEKRDLTDEEDAKVRTMMADMQKLKSKIEAAEERQRIEAEMAASDRHNARHIGRDNPAQPLDAKKTDEYRALALHAWLRSAAGMDIDKDHLEASKALRINPDAKEINLPIRRDYRNVVREYRDLSAFAGNAGGYTVPEGFSNNFEIALLQFGGVREACEVFRTESGNPLPWPTANDTGNKGERLGENTDFGASVDPAFGVINFSAYKYSSKPILIPFELLQDSAFDMAATIGQWCGERIGRIQADEFTTYSAANGPQGIVTASAMGKTTASGSAITSDEVLDLQHSIDPAYRPVSSWMFHDNILLAIRKLKEATTNAYIWQPGLQAGVPDRLLNHPYTINQSMQSSIASGTKTMLFGDMKKFRVRDAGALRLLRLNELYAAKDMVAFIAYLRSDAALIDAGTRPVKHMLQA